MTYLTRLSVLISILLLIFTPGCSDNPTGLGESKVFLSESHNKMADLTLSQAPEFATSPVRISFSKSLVEEGVWEGTVSGDVDGSLQTKLLEVREAGPIWHVVFDWIITDTEGDEQNFTARLNGILNNNTGRVVMNGTIIDGWLEGSRVHEEGQLVDPDQLGFDGTIQINPATAD